MVFFCIQQKGRTQRRESKVQDAELKEKKKFLSREMLPVGEPENSKASSLIKIEK